MKIDKNEIHKLANKIQIHLSDAEIEDISNSIIKITDNIDEILKEKTDESSYFITSAYNEFKIDKKIETEDMIDIKKINNNSGDFIKIKR